MKEEKCEICKKSFPEDQLITGHGIYHEVEDLIRIDYPAWKDNSRICKNDLNKFRSKYLIKIIEDEKGSIKNLEKEVIKSIEDNEIISFSTGTARPLTFGERVADMVASFGGSWKFIIIFFVILLVWISANSILLLLKPFDPFPFILLNLILSCLAAIQAPIIMMSQNRQEMKDRIRSENDYKINLKSEIEIRTLHEKVDHLLLDQWSKMMRIQEIQIEMMEEIRNKK
jgi:uncharacterized membrane protein